jgi:type IV pilus assembly protein PilE
MKNHVLELRKSQGMTLIELLAVVAIVAILATVAVVSYRGHLVRARLQDAKVALETVRAEEEQYRAEFGQYCAPNTLNFFGGAAQVDVGDYQLSFTAQTSTSYRVQANPNPVDGRQGIASSSRYGGWISIDQDGERDSQAQPGTWP